MRQQLCNLTRPLRRQPCQHILEIGIRIMPIEPGDGKLLLVTNTNDLTPI